MVQIHSCNHCETFAKTRNEKSCAIEYNSIIASLLKDFMTENNMTQLFS